MKTYKIFFITYIIFSIIACDKYYNDDPLSADMNPFNHTFYLGDTTHEYYKYSPEINIYLGKKFVDTLPTFIDSIDFENDGIYDLAFERVCFQMAGKPFDINYIEINITGLNFELNFINSTDYFYGKDDTLEYGDILFDNYNWQSTVRYYYDTTLFAFKIFSGDSVSNENYISYREEYQMQWDNIEYFPFKNEYEGIIGWLRMELVTDGEFLRIIDCGIERK